MNASQMLYALESECGRAQESARSTKSAWQHSLRDEAGKARQRETYENAQARLDALTAACGLARRLVDASHLAEFHFGQWREATTSGEKTHSLRLLGREMDAIRQLFEGGAP